MSNIHDTLNAIREATIAFDRIPELEATIKRLEEDLAFAKLEVEEANTKLIQRDERINVLVNTLTNTESVLVAEQDRNATLEAKVYELTSAHNNAQASIRFLETDVSARDTMISLLEADKAALHSRLVDFENMADRLKASIVRTASAALEGAAPMFRDDEPRNLDHREGATQAEPISPEPVVEAIRVAEEVKPEPVDNGFSYNSFNGF